VKEGLICVLTCTEPCYSYRIGRNREKRELELHGERLKCLHHYFYFLHPQLGFLHLRLQTWFPLTIHVCLNGREWLARQMDMAGYVQRDNCFVQLADVEQAQAWCNDQLRVHGRAA
jgi:hypothetical protein